jgi:hypothetical protein
MEVAPKHDTFLEGVLDGNLMIGARLLEHRVEQVGPSGRLPKVPVLGDSDKICVGGVAFRLRLLAFLLRAALGGRLRDVFLLASLRLLVLPEDGLDRLSALLQKLLDVVPQGFPWLLAAASEIPGVPRAHVCALKVSSEGFDQIVPVGDLRRRQML